jgi:hypothetical protein
MELDRDFEAAFSALAGPACARSDPNTGEQQ